jgi:hypothetical protein
MAFLLLKASCIIHLICINLLHLSFIEPLDSFTVFPQTEFNLVLFGDKIGAEAVLLASRPEAFIATSISPSIYTIAMFLIVTVLTLILTAIVPDVDTNTFHVVVTPLSLILATVQPRVDADA